MDHKQAIKKLIDRNKALVNKNGVSQYTTESDSIINALLSYVHDTDKKLLQLSTENERAKIVLQLADLENYLTFDIEWLQRFLKNQYTTFLHEELDRELTIYDLEPLHRYFKTMLIHEVQTYQTLKEIPIQELGVFKSMYPEYCMWIENNYSDLEATKLIKQKLLNSCE